MLESVHTILTQPGVLPSFLLPPASTKVANTRFHQTSAIPTISRTSRIVAHQPRLSIPLRRPSTNNIFLYRSRDCFSSRFLIFQVTIPRVSLLLLPSTPTILLCRPRIHLATFELRRFSIKPPHVPINGSHDPSCYPICQDVSLVSRT